MDIDLAIVGAGPAGVAAAVAFRREAPGLRVVLLERARFPRDKPCGGGLTGLALDELARLGLALTAPVVWPACAVLRADGAERSVDVRGRCAVALRAQLDHELVRQAVERGVDLVEACAVQRVAARAGGFGIETSRGLITASAVVCATGVAGLGRRAAGLNEAEKGRLREAWCGPAPAADALVFDFALAEQGLRGYAWTFPAPGSASNVGVFHLPARGACARLDELTRDHAARAGLAVREPVAYALRCFSPDTGAPGLLLVGEELGADPLTGEGIGYALWSGRLAGEEAAWSLTRARAPDPERFRARLLGSPPGRALAMLAAMARRLYGPQGARYQRLAVSEPAVAEGLADLVIRRAEPLLVAARLGPIWARAKWSGRI